MTCSAPPGREHGNARLPAGWYCVALHIRVPDQACICLGGVPLTYVLHLSILPCLPQRDIADGMLGPVGTCVGVTAHPRQRSRRNQEGEWESAPVRVMALLHTHSSALPVSVQVQVLQPMSYGVGDFSVAKHSTLVALFLPKLPTALRASYNTQRGQDVGHPFVGTNTCTAETKNRGSADEHAAKHAPHTYELRVFHATHTRAHPSASGSACQSTLTLRLPSTLPPAR